MAALVFFIAAVFFTMLKLLPLALIVLVAVLLLKRNQRGSIAGVRECPHCHSRVPALGRYCAFCGSLISPV